MHFRHWNAVLGFAVRKAIPVNFIQLMDIYVDLIALHNDLEAKKFGGYLGTNHFLRQVTKLGLQENWSAANEQLKAEKGNNLDIFDLAFGSENSDLLTCFLNDLYNTKREQFCDVMAGLMGDFIATSSVYTVIEPIVMDLVMLGLTEGKRDELMATWNRHDNDILLKVRNLEDFLIGVGRGNKDDSRFAQLLEPLLAIPDVRKLLPEILVKNTRIAAYWPEIQKVGTYKERDAFIHQQFRPLVEHLQSRKVVMAHSVVISEKHINDQWQKALGRVHRDPEGAITSARTLIETVCKHILDSAGQPFDDNGDVARLYKTAAKSLNLSPDQHAATNFKQILSGASAIVDGLAGLRNTLGDAHGKSHSTGKPAARHAELAVNISGAMSQFLLQTFNSRNQTGS